MPVFPDGFILSGRFVFQIRSDKENVNKILYYIKGPGVDQPPEKRFVIDHNTGFVRVTAILDREDIAVYHVRAPTVQFLFVTWRLQSVMLHSETTVK